VELKKTTAAVAGSGSGQAGERVVNFEINATVLYAPGAATGTPGTTGPAGGAAPKGKG
jgi:hypothetical protein